jgi:small-conductance mechanosensitive channel
VATALALAFGLRAARAAGEEKAAASEASEPAEPVFRAFALIAWLAIVATVTAAVLGFVALALFLANQVIWVGLLLTVLYLLLALIDDLFTHGLTGESTLGRFAVRTLGLRARSVELLGVVLSGVVRLTLILLAATMIMAPWGIGTINVAGWFDAAMHGFTIGGLTIAPGSILTALAIVAAGVVATRGIQRWLDTRYLPLTDIDIGLKNSIRTGVGYACLLLAIGFAASVLGLGLDRLALVAGALSVGIGFGLQSIVNNFVSGLILLAERPIRVGDMVAIGADQGDVRRISVRSTLIQLPDRASLIVPNSELITKPVKNLTHHDPVGRVQIDLSFPFETDIEAVRQIMIESAGAQEGLLKRPEPSVLFTSITDKLNVSLYAYARSPREVARPKSDLHFEIFRRLRAAGIMPAAVTLKPPPAAATQEAPAPAGDSEAPDPAADPSRSA